MDITGMSPRKRLLFDLGFAGMIVGLPLLTWYFAILLVHREWRDARHCASKYGADWDRYTKRVRWRIIPWLY